MNFFGTDGIRGTYGSTITDGTAFLLGKSLAMLGGGSPVIVVGRDTRLSGARLFDALSMGIYSASGNVINVGILPTNSVGHFVRKFGANYGVMISASHNPPCDNGLKVFDAYGVKLCGEKEKLVSETMYKLLQTMPQITAVSEPVFYDADKMYVSDVLKAVNADLTGMNVALDCCFGASVNVAKMLFEKAGAKVTAFCNKHDGKRINVGCGATCTGFLQQKLQNGNYHLAFSFDGDCDRLAVFEGACQVPNNKVFYAMARYLREKQKLAKNTVVGTVLTNGGLEKSLQNLGITLLRSPVGDVNIFNLMAKSGAVFGGEESGHYLLPNFATSSDALINALFLCKIYKEVGSLLKYTADCTDFPFVKQDFPLCDLSRTFTENDLNAVATRVQTLYPLCRIVLRKSGTEEKVRAYVEGEDCIKALDEIAIALKGNKVKSTI